MSNQACLMLLKSMQKQCPDGIPYGSAISSDNDIKETTDKNGLTTSTEAQLMDHAHKAVSVITQIVTGDTSKLNKNPRHYDVGTGGAHCATTVSTSCPHIVMSWTNSLNLKSNLVLIGAP
ncbi:hypothetical protein EVAR_78122_1 [Eumeta japonica]|uniref:Uncharacterized protein n=1 Tax=Eumeta variegata TaxID=151549 RepID=A0A4C1T3G8_EUMVA|nr:hypothetical protein EVAR_78122_1 [Eumeta japonica]